MLISLQSWPFDPWIVAELLATLGLYLRGWRQLRRRGSQRWGGRQLACFLGGLLAIFLALASPIDSLATLLLQVHMIQHLLLMMLAPPLLWLGEPLVPLLRGLPVPVRRYWIAPLLRWRPLRAVLARLTQPVPAWLLLTLATWLWHLPPLYGLALREPLVHHIEHACFLLAGLVFWWPVIEPFPGRLAWSRWLLVPYLILADLQNTALSAWLTFSDRVLYPHYESMPRLGDISVLQDQATAGIIMWVPGSLAYLLPLAWIGPRLLFGQASQKSKPLAARIALPLVGDRAVEKRFDLLEVPVIGRFLKWRPARPALQLLLLLLAGLVIWDGLCGPELTPINLAGVLPWIHWRGLVVLGLLVAGNFFCLACPFQLPRQLGRRLFRPRWSWPRWLRNKWLAVALIVLFFWAYESFSLWNSPWWTAWVALGYFGSASVIDGLFGGASFCKYVCPIGQFHFVQSLTSPLEVAVRNPAICQTCSTKDCIRGNAVSAGCELDLFVPRKAGNLDCTFCLDCIHACPHDNIGMLATLPASALWHDRSRSGLGRLSRRPDLAAMAAVLVFAAFANAAGMTAPVVAWQNSFGLPFVAATLFYLLAVLVLPCAMILTVSGISRHWGADPGAAREHVCRFVYALVPIGAAMWLTHYSFHLLTSASTAIAASQRFLLDLGMPFLGEPAWSCCCAAPPAEWLVRLQIVALGLGLLLSFYTGWRISLDRSGRTADAARMLVPWAVLALLLYAAGIWIVLQPMEMRGAL